jgi:phosphodiesterase/alkaline phosphatase D-like protein
MADLVLGPLLRYVGTEEATVWVETGEPCEVEVLGARAATFSVEGHHYALVRIEGLEPGSRYEYEVELDGERRWPEAGSELPPSLIRTLGPADGVEIAFGSCRVAAPHEPPYTLTQDEHESGFEFDALRVLASEMIESEPGEWPQILLLLGDQIYVDEAAPETRAFIRARRDTGGEPGDGPVAYAEYARLYHETWSDPYVRWLLSTVSTSMVWDDHDMHDDWNISHSWNRRMREKEWWHERLVAGLESYWVYQHIGNLSPRELDEEEQWRRIDAGDDATEVLREFAKRADTTEAGTRWSYCRDVGRTRMVVLDDRAGRVLREDRRAIFDEDEWDWIVDHASGDFDHLVLAASDPYLLIPAMHHLEAWNEMVCDGVWGRQAARLGERLRREVDFDHWGAFRTSFGRLRDLLEEVGSGRRGQAPKNIVLLGGDVHHAYLAEVAFRPSAGVRSAVYQAVCSPFRNPLSSREQRVVKASNTRPAELLTRGLARVVGAPDPGLRWRLCEGPYFDNQVATLVIEGRRAALRLEKTVPGESENERELETVFDRELS